MRFRNWFLSEASQHSFSSTQINFSKSDAKKVLEWSHKFVPEKFLCVNEKASGREDQIHVTVLYGLHTDVPDPVIPVLKKFKPFEIKLGYVTKFEADGYDVLKISVIDSPMLHKVNKALSKLEHTNKYEYTPHCTIAYVKAGSCDHLLNSEAFMSDTIKVSEIVFSNKDRKHTSIKL